MPEPKEPRLVQTKHGYWTYEPKPTTEELSRYYAERYYQEAKGSYETSYTDEEVRYFRLKARLIRAQLGRLRRPGTLKSLLDVGCGEGWILDLFQKSGYAVKGWDFSAFGLEKFHPHLKPFFEQGDVLRMLRESPDHGCWDVVILANVIEHVADPEALLAELRQLLSPTGVLLILTPNDFSPLQAHLLERGAIKEPFWLAYPDHLSYFNKPSFEALLADQGFQVEAVVADNPIDLNLLNDNSNYVADRGKGKNTHHFRVRTDNFLAGISEDLLLDLYTTLGAMGVGRDLNYYCVLK